MVHWLDAIEALLMFLGLFFTISMAVLLFFKLCFMKNRERLWKHLYNDGCKKWHGRMQCIVPSAMYCVLLFRNTSICPHEQVCACLHATECPLFSPTKFASVYQTITSHYLRLCSHCPWMMRGCWWWEVSGRLPKGCSGASSGKEPRAPSFIMMKLKWCYC